MAESTLAGDTSVGHRHAELQHFTPTYVLSNKITWGGWNAPAPNIPDQTGVTRLAGNNAYVFSVIAPEPADSTLADAITQEEYLTATFTPALGPIDLRGGEVRFSTRRIEHHSPRGYALYSSLDSFATPLYTSPVVDKDNFDEVEHIVTLPSTAAFQAVNTTVTLRIVAFSAQFSGHDTSLTGFKLTEKNPLTVTALSPSAGPTTAGPSVIIDGTDLASATTVTFSGTAGTITSNTATAITVTPPSGPQGSVNVVVTTPGGSLTLTGAYRFVSAPAIGSIVANSGSGHGGDSITITGTNLGNTTSVTFGGLPAPVISNTATSLVVISPPHAAGAVNVVVTRAGGSATSTNGYTYTVPVPPAAPAGLIAESVSTSQVNLSWTLGGGVTSYEIDRKSPGGSFTVIGTSVTNAFSNSGLPADTAFLYRVRAVNTGGISSNSDPALATTVSFTDEPLGTGTTLVKRGTICSSSAPPSMPCARWPASVRRGSRTRPSPRAARASRPNSVVKQSHFQEIRALVK